MAVIPNCSHLYCTVKFKGLSTGAWAGEMWQYGVRLKVGATQVDLNDGVVDLGAFSVQDAAVQRTAGNYSVEQAWSGVTEGARTITDADQDAIVNALFQPMLDNLTNLSNQYEAEVVKIYAVHKAPDGRWLSGSPNAYYRTAQTKGAATASLPPDSAAVVSFYSATRGVKGRGRVYVGGLGLPVLSTSGRFTSNWQDALGTKFATAFADIRGLNDLVNGYRYTPIIWHRPGDKAGIEDGTRGSVISRVEVNDVVDTQRRRDKQAQVNWESYSI